MAITRPQCEGSGKFGWRFRVFTLGCKVNQYESAAVTEALTRAGLSAADGRDGPADLLVVNTCCVTVTAMAKSRHAIARAVRRAPHAAVWILGCYSDYDAVRLRQLLARLGVPPEKAVIAGHHDDLSTRILQVLALLSRPGVRRTSVGLVGQEQRTSVGGLSADAADTAASCVSTSTPAFMKTSRRVAVKQKLPGTNTLPALRRFPGRHRALVKIQDGCDAFCSYCIVPYVRCRLHSRPAETVEGECRDLLAAGHREIVLCGIFLGAYGRGTARRQRWGRTKSHLPDLLARIARLEGLWRVRLSSLECGDVTDELLAVCTETGTVAPHFHLPLQSGSPRILRRMNRQYTVEQFLDAVERLRAAFDRPAITTDVLVGFPTEDEGDFTATLEVARRAGFAKIHAFPFSPVEPTAGWVMRHKAPPPGVIKRRMAALATLEAELTVAFRAPFTGQEVQALIERSISPADGRGRRCIARTDRYFTIALSEPHLRPGQVVSAIVEGPAAPGTEHMPARLIDILDSTPSPR